MTDGKEFERKLLSSFKIQNKHLLNISLRALPLDQPVQHIYCSVGAPDLMTSSWDK